MIICSRSRDAILNFRFFSDFNSLIFPVFVTPVSTIRHPFSIVFRKNIIFNSRTESFSSIFNQSELLIRRQNSDGLPILRRLFDDFLLIMLDGNRTSSLRKSNQNSSLLKNSDNSCNNPTVTLKTLVEIRYQFKVPGIYLMRSKYITLLRVRASKRASTYKLSRYL